MFSIGEFSLISRLSIKTLRYYHEQGLLIPDYIDEDSGYRYYKENSIDRALVLAYLRSLDFSINDIKKIFENYSEDVEIIKYLEQQKEKMIKAIEKYTAIENSIDSLIKNIRSNEMKDKNVEYTITEKHIEDILFASQRYTGKYHEVGKVFGFIGKKAGRYVKGKAMSLYYQMEYKDMADIEAGFPIKKEVQVEGVNCKTLKGGKAVTLIHKGPYNTIGESYKKLFNYINEKKYKTSLPSREVYLKGPGMIFKGNPDKYLTEIQVFI